MDSKKIVIVGGVAGGASCAARARRNSEKAEIIMIERGPFVSFANCGLPYHVGNVIRKEDDLLVATPELFRNRFAIEVRTRCEAVSIDRENKTVALKNLVTGEEYRESYDVLVLAPGASPFRPPIPGMDLPGIFTLRNIPDTRAIREWVKAKHVKRALVAGAGFIGMEMAENLIHRKIAVTVVELEKHALPALDPEMSSPIQDVLAKYQADLRTGTGVSSISQGPSGLLVKLSDGDEIETDMVLMSVGVRPETALARGCGLEVGVTGGIKVDGFMRTNDPSIYAVGDAVEVNDRITGLPRLLAMAGPANRQGRLAADVILNVNDRKPFAGVIGSAVCGVFEVTAAMTGHTEKSLARCAAQGKAIPYDTVTCHPPHHSTYYPNAERMALKLIFGIGDGKILGAQAVGGGGVARRIDVIASYIDQNGTVYDLEDAELCYAPPFGSAKDPVNIAGMIAANALRGYSPIVHWTDPLPPKTILIDVRDPDETVRQGYAGGALLIPLETLRKTFSELPKDRQIWVYCQIGQRAHYAVRLLRENGYDARNVTGGFTTYIHHEPFYDLP
ncbi:MAG: FAD-dependent oxidoreductase [Deltaproteobacteria bacterium]|nr:FAD-dependent oxidoreductase [Deltaproteobacteria bacterium]